MVTSESGSPARNAALRALDQALEAARQEGRGPTGRRVPQTQRSQSTGQFVRRRRSRWTGPGEDIYDPHLLGSILKTEVKRRGWRTRVSAEDVVSRWDEIVGPGIAEHCISVTINGSTLEVSAESTAWATQLRMLQATILSKISKMVGPGVLTQMKITGPRPPSWRKGPLHVRGRGPRDTYG